MCNFFKPKKKVRVIYFFNMPHLMRFLGLNNIMQRLIYNIKLAETHRKKGNKNRVKDIFKMFRQIVYVMRQRKMVETISD